MNGYDCPHAVPRGLFSWSKAGLFWALVRANTTESRSAVQVGPLEIWIAEPSWCGHAAAAVNYTAVFYPLPSPATFYQSWTADNCKTLILKFTWTPNMLGTIVLVFIQQRIHLVQNNKLCMVHTKKYEVHNDIVMCVDFSQQNNLHIYHNISISTTENLHLKSGPTLQKPPRVCKQHNTCGNPAKWKARGQPASTDHLWY